MTQRRAGLLAFVVAGAVALGVFGVCLALGVEPGRGFTASGAGAAAALLGVGLLAIDAVAPVPSLAVIAALGAAFGVPGGSALSVIGLVAGSGLAYWSGSLLRRGSGRGAADVPSGWSLVGVVLLRGVPILGEASAVSAGVVGVAWRRFVAVAVIGAIPVAMLGTLGGDALVSR